VQQLTKLLYTQFSYSFKTISFWFRDEIFRRLFINAGKLLSAGVVTGVIGVVVMVLSARTLGPENFGILALVIVYEQTVGKLFSFNAWQAIIKFGADALQYGNVIGFRQLIKFGFILDTTSAIAGFILAITLSAPIIYWLDWDFSIRELIILYSVLILFNINGTPIGILRLFDRFDILSFSIILASILRLIGVIWCVLTDQGLYGFVFAYLISAIIGQTYQVLSSIWVLWKNRVGNFLPQSLFGINKNFSGIWDYVWTTNLNSTIRLVSRELDEILVAALTTPTALGLYKVAKQFSRALPLIVDPLYQSIYPELARLWTKNKVVELLSLIKRSTLIVCAFAVIGWVIFIIFGKWLIDIMVGVSYQDAYPTAVFYMFALVVALATFSFQPSMLAFGLPKASFTIQLIVTVIFLASLIPLVNTLGIIGAALSYVLYNLLWSLLMFVKIRRVIYEKQIFI
jgi:O-antigen/teichoic acid export membrane protein